MAAFIARQSLGSREIITVNAVKCKQVTNEHKRCNDQPETGAALSDFNYKKKKKKIIEHPKPVSSWRPQVLRTCSGVTATSVSDSGRVQRRIRTWCRRCRVKKHCLLWLLFLLRCDTQDFPPPTGCCLLHHLLFFTFFFLTNKTNLMPMLVSELMFPLIFPHWSNYRPQLFHFINKLSLKKKKKSHCDSRDNLTYREERAFHPNKYIIVDRSVYLMRSFWSCWGDLLECH